MNVGIKAMDKRTEPRRSAALETFQVQLQLQRSQSLNGHKVEYPYPRASGLGPGVNRTKQSSGRAGKLCDENK